MNWLIDASMGCRDGLFCFCPFVGDIAGKFTTYDGLMRLSDSVPPGVNGLVVWHPEGQEECNAFVNEHRARLLAMMQGHELGLT